MRNKFWVLRIGGNGRCGDGLDEGLRCRLPGISQLEQPARGVVLPLETGSLSGGPHGSEAG